MKHFYGAAADVEKVINYYYNNNTDETIDIIENFVIQDFINLGDKYRNYNLYLLNIFNDYDNDFMYRKLLINLVVFMSDRDDDDDKTLLRMMIIIKLWYKLNIATNILKETFIPKIFAKWFKNYIFYLDYFCVIATNTVKDKFYNTFFYLVINHDTVETVEEKLVILSKIILINQCTLLTTR